MSYRPKSSRIRPHTGFKPERTTSERLDIEVSGHEMPLLDGGASAWCAALAELELAADPLANAPTLAITLP